jgi:hypothetical protein
MKPRHAAALALVGWYLMEPPFGDDLRPKISAPLHEWNGQWDDEADRERAPFLTLPECEARKAADKQEFLDDAKKYPELRDMWVQISRDETYAQCVKSDDPRLEDPEVQKLLQQK